MFEIHPRIRKEHLFLRKSKGNDYRFYVSKLSQKSIKTDEARRKTDGLMILVIPLCLLMISPQCICIQFPSSFNALKTKQTTFHHIDRPNHVSN